MLSRKLERTKTISKQHEAALPVVRKDPRQERGQAAALEMVGQQGKPEQQAEQIGKRHPFVAARATGPERRERRRKIAETELVEGDHRQPGQRDAHRLVVKQRDAKQRGGEKDEIQGNSGYNHDISGGDSCGEARLCRLTDESFLIPEGIGRSLGLPPGASSEQAKGQHGDQRRRQRRGQQAERMHRLVVEMASQDREAGRVRRVGDHGQAAAGHGAGHDRVLELVGKAVDQRARYVNAALSVNAVSAVAP